MGRALAILALAGFCAGLNAQDSNSYKGKTPPELKGEKDHWLNAKDALVLEKLKGRVVWLEFSFLG